MYKILLGILVKNRTVGLFLTFSIASIHISTYQYMVENLKKSSSKDFKMCLKTVLLLAHFRT